MSKITLTIAVPVYNGGIPLMEAIESCKHVDLPFDNFEILIVDNCSTDGMLEKILIKFGDQLPLRIVHNEINCGRINNWNKCIEYAQGDFILFLFANDLITENNAIKDAVSLLQNNEQCALVSSPWIYSDFLRVTQFIEPEYFKRTPGNGYYDAFAYIQKVIETGKLPFVCLQSCFLRTFAIKKAGILFDQHFPITTDGIFLSNLAIETGLVGFIDRPTMIFRHNAPNRQHANVKLHEHVEQMQEAFVRISRLSDKLRIDLTLAFSNFSGLENLIAFLLRNPNPDGLKKAKIIVISWWKSIRKFNLNTTLFYLRMAKRFLLLPFKGIVFLSKEFNKRYFGQV